MDPDLIAYLDQRFRETAQQISALREETMGRFDQVDRRFEQVDSRFEQVDSRFEQVEETGRQTRILVEGLRHEIQLVAEGFLGLDYKIERFHSEATVVFDTIRGWIEPYYRELDGRIRTLDSRTSTLDSRTSTLETRSQDAETRLRLLERRAELQVGDAMDGVRKVLGKPPRASSQ